MCDHDLDLVRIVEVSIIGESIVGNFTKEGPSTHPHFFLNFLLRSKTDLNECPFSASIPTGNYHCLISLRMWQDCMADTV